MRGETPEKEQSPDTSLGYVFPDVEQAIPAAPAEVDPTRRQELLDRAQDMVWNTWPCMWAFVPKAVLARRTRVQNLELKSTNSFDLSTTTLAG